MAVDENPEGGDISLEGCELIYRAMDLLEAVFVELEEVFGNRVNSIRDDFFLSLLQQEERENGLTEQRMSRFLTDCINKFGKEMLDYGVEGHASSLQVVLKALRERFNF